MMNADANFIQSWGVSLELFFFIALFWTIIVIIILGFQTLNNGLGPPVIILFTMGTCLLIKGFGWQVLAIPAGVAILFSGLLMYQRR
jgi:hypothetical protein